MFLSQVSNRLNWIYVTNIRIDTPDVTLVNETLPAESIPQCVVKTRPHIVNSNLEAADGNLMSVKSTPMICTSEGLAEATSTITSLVSTPLVSYVCWPL